MEDYMETGVKGLCRGKRYTKKSYCAGSTGVLCRGLPFCFPCPHNVEPHLPVPLARTVVFIEPLGGFHVTMLSMHFTFLMGPFT